MADLLAFEFVILFDFSTQVLLVQDQLILQLKRRSVRHRGEAPKLRLRRGRAVTAEPSFVALAAVVVNREDIARWIGGDGALGITVALLDAPAHQPAIQSHLGEGIIF